MYGVGMLCLSIEYVFNEFVRISFRNSLNYVLFLKAEDGIV